VFSTEGMSDKEISGKKFFESFLIDKNGGVYCSATMGWPDEPTACSNHEFGSERQGLAMLYYAYAGDCENFDKLTEFLKEYMLSPVGLVYWKLNEDYDHSHYQASASIDDIRIVQALLTAYEKFDNPDYYDLGMTIANALKKYTVNKDGYFTEGASWDDEGVYTARQLYLSYANLEAMDIIAKYDPAWIKIKEKTGALILKGAYIDGLFHDLYKFTFKKYSKDSNLNSIHEATTGLNLVSYNRLVAKKNLNFWKYRWNHEFMEGVYPHIASSYSPKGVPLCKWCADISVYSLISQLAHKLGDTVFEAKMINAINQLNDGEFAGAFSWDEDYEISSYANALALIALAVQRGAND